MTLFFRVDIFLFRGIWTLGYFGPGWMFVGFNVVLVHSTFNNYLIIFLYYNILRFLLISQGFVYSYKIKTCGSKYCLQYSNMGQSCNMASSVIRSICVSMGSDLYVCAYAIWSICVCERPDLYVWVWSHLCVYVYPYYLPPTVESWVSDHMPLMKSMTIF